jgi:hypothetical protein
MTDKLMIDIDITDWNEEYLSNQFSVVTVDDIIEYAKDGIKPMLMGRTVIVAREREETNPGIIDDNKHCLNRGAAINISHMISRRMKELNTENGKSIKVRELVCATEQSKLKVVVDSTTKEGCDNAISYLLNNIPGYIRGRLAIVGLALGAEGVREYANKLIGIIGEIEEEIISKLE